MNVVSHTPGKWPIDLASPMPVFTDPLCAQIGPEPFFLEFGQSSKPGKDICSMCDHQAECLTWALETGQRYGIFGGATPHERKLLRSGGKRGRPAGAVERDSRVISPETRAEMAERAPIANAARWAKREAS